MVDKEKPTPAEAERLLKAIFSDKEFDDKEFDDIDNYPDTVREKVGYSQYVVTHILGDIGKAIHRLNRLYSLLGVAEKGGKNELPDVITNNELRMALGPLRHIQWGIDEIIEILIGVYNETKTEKPKEE